MICNLIKFNYLIKNTILDSFSLFLFKKTNFKKNDRILIFRTGELGDNLCAIPAINLIKHNFKNAKIDMLVTLNSKTDVSFEALLQDGLIDGYIDYTNIKKKSLLRTLKSNNYDLIIHLPQNMSSLYQQLRDMIFFRLCNIPHGFGWKVNSDLFLKKYQDRCMDSKNEVDRLLALLTSNGLKKYDKEYPLNIKKNDIDLVHKKLKINNLQNANKNIAFVIGAKIYPKEWNVKNFELVADYFVKKGYKILLIGGREDKEKSQYLLSKVSENIYDFCGEFTPIQSILILKSSLLVLTNDTGPMHMSACVNTPMVALFSSWSYDKKWYPDSDCSIVIRKELECSICYNRSCPDNICMQSITTSEVIEAIEKIINEQN